MTAKLLDISGKIDSLTVAILENIVTVADKKKINLFIVGATARDIVLEHGYGIKSKKATLDIDFGVQVSNWNEFEKLIEGLLATGKFIKAKEKQRLLYEGNFKVDVIPFGAIMGANHTIIWPPENDTVMKILGFDVAYNSALTVRIRQEPALDILVTSPQALALLKLVAWSERTPEDTRDAQDLAFILTTYISAGNQIRLEQEYPDLLDDDFDYELTGGRMLGRDLDKIMSSDTREFVLALLNDQTKEQDKYRLVEDMTTGYSSDDFQRNLQLLILFRQGVMDND